MLCAAKGKLVAREGQETSRADFRLQFELNEEKSRLNFWLLDLFHQPRVHFEITPQTSRFTNESGTHSLNELPLFKKWYRKNWWSDLAFQFGLLTSNRSGQIYENTNSQLVALIEGTREIRCSYLSLSSKFPNSCKIIDKDLDLKLDFAFSDCKSPL